MVMRSPRMSILKDSPPAPRRAGSAEIAQRARRAQLDDIRIKRRLSDAEQTEADRLTHCLYMREWRASQAERWGPPSRVTASRATVSRGTA